MLTAAQVSTALPHLFPERCDLVGFLKALPHGRLGSAALRAGRVTLAGGLATPAATHINLLASRRRALQQQMIQAVLADHSATIDHLFLFERADPSLSTTTGMPLLEFAKERGKASASRCLQKWARLHAMLEGLRTTFAGMSRASGEPLMRRLDASGRGYVLPAEFARTLQTTFDVKTESDAWVLYHLVTVGKEQRDSAALLGSPRPGPPAPAAKADAHAAGDGDLRARRRSTVFDALDSWRAATVTASYVEHHDPLDTGPVDEDGVRVCPYRLRAFLRGAHTSPSAAKLFVAPSVGRLVAVVRAAESGMRVGHMEVVDGVLDATELAEGRYSVDLATDLCSAVSPPCAASLVGLATFVIFKQSGRVRLEEPVLRLPDVHLVEITSSSYQYFAPNLVLQGRFERDLGGAAADTGGGGGGGGGGGERAQAFTVALKPEPDSGLVSLLLPPGRLTLRKPSAEATKDDAGGAAALPSPSRNVRLPSRQGARLRARVSVQRLSGMFGGGPSDFVVGVPVTTANLPPHHNSFRVDESLCSAPPCAVMSWGASVRTKFRESVWRALARHRDRTLEPFQVKSRLTSWASEAKTVSSAPCFDDILYKPDDGHDKMHSDSLTVEEERRRLIFPPVPEEGERWTARRASTIDGPNNKYAVPVYNGASARLNADKTVDVVLLCDLPTQDEVEHLMLAPAMGVGPEALAAPFAIFAGSPAALTMSVTDEVKKAAVLDAHGLAAAEDGDGVAVVPVEVQVGHAVCGSQGMNPQSFVPSLRVVAATHVCIAMDGKGYDVSLRFTMHPDVRLKQNVFNFGPKNMQFLANGTVVAEARVELVPEAAMYMPASFAFYNALTRCVCV